MCSRGRPFFQHSSLPNPIEAMNSFLLTNPSFAFEFGDGSFSLSFAIKEIINTKKAFWRGVELICLYLYLYRAHVFMPIYEIDVHISRGLLASISVFAMFKRNISTPIIENERRTTCFSTHWEVVFCELFEKGSEFSWPQLNDWPHFPPRGIHHLVKTKVRCIPKTRIKVQPFFGFPSSFFFFISPLSRFYFHLLFRSVKLNSLPIFWGSKFSLFRIFGWARSPDDCPFRKRPDAFVWTTSLIIWMCCWFSEKIKCFARSSYPSHFWGAQSFHFFGFWP